MVEDFFEAPQLDGTGGLVAGRFVLPRERPSVRFHAQSVVFGEVSLSVEGRARVFVILFSAALGPWET